MYLDNWKSIDDTLECQCACCAIFRFLILILCVKSKVCKNGVLAAAVCKCSL